MPVAEAIAALAGLIQLTQQIVATIGKAQAEGRDLTDAEMQLIIGARKIAEAALDKTLSG